jgi:hypothetical protein
MDRCFHTQESVVIPNFFVIFKMGGFFLRNKGFFLLTIGFALVKASTL